MSYVPTRDSSAHERWTTPLGTIVRGMQVLAPDGRCIGTVTGLEGEQLHLAGGAGGFVLLSEVDGVSADAVLLQDRGDATFGIGGPV